MNGEKTGRAGDRLHIPGRPPATILVGGAPPYRVMYDGGRTAMVVPGPDAVLEPVSFAEVAAGLPEPKPLPAELGAPAPRSRNRGTAGQTARAEVSVGEAP